MKTDDLILKLSADLKPVVPPEKPVVFATRWSVVSLTLIVIGVLLGSARGDLAEALSRAGTQLEIFSFAGLLFTSLLLVSWVSSPGRSQPVRLSQLLLSFIALCGAVNFFNLFGMSREVLRAGANVSGSRCTFVAAAIGILTGAFFAYKSKQGASTNPLMSGLLVGLAAMGAAGIGITLDCGSDNGMHIMLWHFLLPLTLMTGLGFVLGKKFLRW